MISVRPGHAVYGRRSFTARPLKVRPARLGEGDAFENVRRHVEFPRRFVEERGIIGRLHFLRELGDGFQARGIRIGGGLRGGVQKSGRAGHRQQKP